MKETIIAVGNGGYNLATDLIAAGLFPDADDRKDVFNLY